MVKKKILVVNWNKKASIDLQKLYNYIREESHTNAEKVRKGIVNVVDSLPKNPEKHPLDKFKKNNPGNYRAFEKFSFRVAYRHTEHEIRVLRIRHVKREPKQY